MNVLIHITAADTDEELYTYTVITTSSNADLKFLHDRMPVILDPGSKAMATWLDPHRTTWSKELQSLLKPYDGELEVYPVSKDVGKVGNNSPDFIIPVNSKENKKNIANFFANASNKQSKNAIKEEEKDTSKSISTSSSGTSINIKNEMANTDEKKEELESQPSKHGAKDDQATLRGNLKRKQPHGDECEEDEGGHELFNAPKIESHGKHKKVSQAAQSPNKERRKMHSATSNNASKEASTPRKASQGNQRITNFFKK